MLIRTVTLGLAGFFLIGGFNISGTAINSVIVEVFGAEGIPLADLFKAFTATACCLFVLYHRKFRVKLSGMMFGLNSIAFAYLVAFPYLDAGFPVARRPLVLALALAGSALITSGVYCVWMLLTSIVPEAKGRHFTLFAAFMQVAVIAAAHLVRYLLTVDTVTHLLWYGAAGYLVSFALILFAMLRFSCAGGRLADFAMVDRDAIDRPLRTLAGLFARPYIRGLFTVILIEVAFGSMLSWRVFRIAQEEKTIEDVAGLLNVFSEYVGWAALVCQLVVVPLLFRFLTPRYGLLVLPGVGLGILGAIGLSVPVLAVLISIAGYQALDYTANNCMRESLYLPLPLPVKVHFKSVLAFLAPRAGAVLSSVLLLAASRWSLWIWYAGLGILGAVWLAVAWQVLHLYARYIAEAAEVVRVSNVDGIGAEADRVVWATTKEKRG